MRHVHAFEQSKLKGWKFAFSTDVIASKNKYFVILINNLKFEKIARVDTSLFFIQINQFYWIKTNSCFLYVYFVLYKFIYLLVKNSIVKI